MYMQKFMGIFTAPIGKFRVITGSDNFLEEEPQILDFSSFKKAKDAADRESTRGRRAEVYDSKGEFVYSGAARRR